MHQSVGSLCLASQGISTTIGSRPWALGFGCINLIIGLDLLGVDRRVWIMFQTGSVIGGFDTMLLDRSTSLGNILDPLRGAPWTVASQAIPEITGWKLRWTGAYSRLVYLNRSLARRVASNSDNCAQFTLHISLTLSFVRSISAFKAFTSPSKVTISLL